MLQLMLIQFGNNRILKNPSTASQIGQIGLDARPHPVLTVLLSNYFSIDPKLDRLYYVCEGLEKLPVYGKSLALKLSVLAFLMCCQFCFLISFLKVRISISF